VSPIDYSTSTIATAAASGETPGDGSWRATRRARSLACGTSLSQYWRAPFLTYSDRLIVASVATESPIVVVEIPC
jgi:hypothetical protein